MKERFEQLSEALLLARIGDRRAFLELRRGLEALLADAGSGPMASCIREMIGQVEGLEASGARADSDWSPVEAGILALQARVDGGPEGSPPARPASDSDQGPGLPSALSGSAGGAAPVDEEIWKGFILESREHLEAADMHLLELNADASNREALHTVFRAFHTLKGTAGCLDQAALQALAHEAENLLELARHGSLPMSGVAVDVAFEAVDAMKQLIDLAERDRQSVLPGDVRIRLADVIRRIQEVVSSAAETREGASAPEPGSGFRGEPSPSPEPLGEPASASPSAAESGAAAEPVRVDADRLDRLVNLIGELVIVESMVSQSAELRSAGGTRLEKSVNQLDKITRQLQEMGMSLRMVPVRPLFHKMARLARDLSRKLGKPVDFVTSGDDIEIDKAIVNCVTDALVHLIRNSLDHGIESDSAERLGAGKPAAGQVELRAFHREGCIVIEVQDDGRGLDPAAIQAKALEKGIIRKDEVLSESEILKLVFLPGFSTAKEVTEFSGRGVGLDVVRSSVDALRGRIEVDSEPGRGTTFRLRLPLTLAVIDGMVLRAGAERFVVPTLSITRLVRPQPEQLSRVLGRGELLLLQDEVIPLHHLNRLLRMSEGAPEASAAVAVVVEDGGKRAAILADEVLGQQQIVIKNLGVDLERAPGISGGVILADGEVGLILDVNGLLSSPAPALRSSAAAGSEASR